MANENQMPSGLQPQNIEAEQSLLSAIMIDNSVLDEVAEIVRADDFYATAHKKIFAAIVELNSQGKPADLVTLVNLLRNKNLLEKIGGAIYLSRIVDAVPMAVHAAHYAAIIRRKAALRSLIRKGNEIINRCSKCGDEVEAAIDFAERSIMEISTTTAPAACRRVEAHLDECPSCRAELERRKEQLTMLASDLSSTGVAAGDLGAEIAHGRTKVAEEVLDEVIRERVPGPFDKIESRISKLLQRFRYSSRAVEKLGGGRRGTRRLLLALGGVLLLGLLASTLCMGGGGGDEGDNVMITVPNSQVWGNEIKNYNGFDTRRVDLVMGISYDDDIQVALDTIRQIVAADERVLPEPEIQIAVSELADSSVNIIVRPWCAGSDYWPLRFDLTRRLKEGLEAAGCSIPYPQQDVYMHQVAS